MADTLSPDVPDRPEQVPGEATGESAMRAAAHRPESGDESDGPEGSDSYVAL